MEQRMAAVVQRLPCADADARYRLAVLQRKCEEMERVLRVLEGRETRQETQEQLDTLPVAADQQQHVAEVGQSIQDAIARARKVRSEMAGRVEAAGGESDEVESQGEAETDRALRGILSMAKTISKSQPTSEKLAIREARAPPKAEGADARPLQEKRLHVEYPRKLRAIVERLQDKRCEPFRFAFCCKVNEHLSTDATRRRALENTNDVQKTRLDAPIARIQVSFDKQAERLARAYSRLALFMNDKLAADSPELQRVLEAPSLPRLIPFCARLKLAKQMQRVLGHESDELAKRSPPQPSLSAAAVAHRDAILARIRRKRPSNTAANTVTVTNAPLLASEMFSSGSERDLDFMDALQDAWAASDGSSSSPPVVYPAKLRELVLLEASTLVLEAFKQLFASSDLAPRESDVASMMQLVRLIDSVALTRGRRYRSIVAPTPNPTDC